MYDFSVLIFTRFKLGKNYCTNKLSIPKTVLICTFSLLDLYLFKFMDADYTETRLCKCGVSFIVDVFHLRKKYCSPGCRPSYYKPVLVRKSPQTHVVTCPCGKEFHSSSRRALYCSLKCRYVFHQKEYLISKAKRFPKTCYECNSKFSANISFVQISVAQKIRTSTYII